MLLCRTVGVHGIHETTSRITPRTLNIPRGSAVPTQPGTKDLEEAAQCHHIRLWVQARIQREQKTT